ncbi:MAG TPA: fluoride efflux transporter CrcB [Calditrichia bacterium]|nr:fluoride efflux transporter CrcB [Calditrichia bacterium]
MEKILMIGLGGFLGAILRFWVGGLVFEATHVSGFPLGTLAVNLLGAFILGGLSGAFHLFEPHSQLWFFLTTGTLGAFTTFSTFSVETLNLIQEGHPGRALLYLTVSVLGGLLLAAAGFYTGRHLN